MNEMSATPSIERRSPVVNPKEFPEVDTIVREWALLTEAVKREMLSDPEVRRSLLKFSGKSVSEDLADEAIHLLAKGDERIARLATRYGESLGTYLSLSAIPDDQLQPDVSYAPSLQSPEKVLELMESVYGKNTPQYNEALQQRVDGGDFLRGITAHERLLVLTRYAFARDVKILALGAEILNQGSKVAFDEAGEVVLPSGIRMVIDSSDPEVRSDFLNPHAWEKRKQFKDRIYEIEVNGRRYFLKEKKTARHRDTKKGGHKEGRSSSEEFAVAKHLQDKGTVGQGNINLTWEKPVGFVEYPDGFQFSVFEFEEGLQGDTWFNQQLAEGIMNHREQFEDEFVLLCSLASKFKNSPELSGYQNRDSVSGLKAIVQWLRRSKPKPEEPESLTYEGFAKVKAFRMERQAGRLMRETVLNLGYTNSDIDGYAYRIHSNKDELKLEIVGFDFEYYRETSAERLAEIRERQNEHDPMFETRISFGQHWSDGSPVTLMERATYLALLEAEGLLYKPKEF